MRKILIYTIFLFPFIACHLKEEEPSKPKEEITDKNDPFQEFKKELGIPQEVEIQGQESGYPDPENTYTIGKYKNTFYFYLIRNKKIIAQYQETLPEKVIIDGRNFNTEELKLNFYRDNEVRVGRIVAQQPLVEPQGFREDKDRYYHKKFVFSNDKIYEVSLEKLYGISKEGDLGFFVQIYSRTDRPRLAYNKEWQLLGKVAGWGQSNYWENDTFYAIKNKNTLTLFRMNNKQVTAKYTYILPFSDEDVVPIIEAREKFEIFFEDNEGNKKTYSLKFENDKIIPNT